MYVCMYVCIIITILFSFLDFMDFISICTFLYNF